MLKNDPQAYATDLKLHNISENGGNLLYVNIWKKKQINLYFLMQITFRKIKNKYTLENFNTLHHISRVRNVLIFLCTSRLN